MNFLIQITLFLKYIRAEFFSNKLNLDRPYFCICTKR
jgi:hypothetical protein